MALAETTFSSAVAIGDSQVSVASATSVAEGRLILAAGEVMRVAKGYVAASTTVPVLRGQDGTVQRAHPATLRIVHGDASDFAAPAPGQVVGFPVAGRSREVRSYSAAGAISLPSPGNDMVAIINGTALAMTLANPTKDMDGCVLYVIQDTAAAHTITYTAGFGGAGGSYDVLTANGTGTAAVAFIAANELWCLLPAVTGTLTNAAWALA